MTLKKDTCIFSSLASEHKRVYATLDCHWLLISFVTLIGESILHGHMERTCSGPWLASRPFEAWTVCIRQPGTMFPYLELLTDNSE